MDRPTDGTTDRGGRGAHSFAPLAPQQSVPLHSIPLCFAPLYSAPLHAALQFNLSKINAFGLGGTFFCPTRALGGLCQTSRGLSPARGGLSQASGGLIETLGDQSQALDLPGPGKRLLGP